MKPTLLFIFTCFFFPLVAQLMPEASDDQFGADISLSYDGTWLAVGAPKNDGNGDDAGHVRVYEFVSGNWVQRGSDIDGVAADDRFGSKVSISHDGSRVATGAFGNDANGDRSGHVRVFEYDGSDWVQLGNDINGPVTFALFGNSLSFSGDGQRVATGGVASSMYTTSDTRGYVRIFEYDGSDWVQLGSDLIGEAVGDRFGEQQISLSANGSRIAVGAHFNDGNGNNSGHARIFEYDGSDGVKNWVQLGSDIDGLFEEQSGNSVSLSDDGNRVAIGSPLLGGTQLSNGGLRGGARVYEYNGASWVQLGSDIEAPVAGDQLARDLELAGDGNRLIISAPLADYTFPNGANAENAGYTQVYDYDQTMNDWVLFLTISSKTHNGSVNAQFGISVSISGDGSKIIAGRGDGKVGDGSYSGYDTPLPIELMSFEASVREKEVHLAWQTASETNNDFFTLEKSKNGEDWSVFAEIDGAGNSSEVLSYAYTDHTPYHGVSYYRLKQTDFDGQFEYSDMLVVDVSEEVNNYLIYPNPVFNDITLRASERELSNITVQDLSGQDVTHLSKEQSRNSGKVVLDLNNLPTGMYLIKTRTTASRIFKK